MKRSRSVRSDSLDLLLDTICNTFGGVLFIALLVVILLNLSSTTVSVTPPSAKSQIRLKEAQVALREVQDRLEALATARAQQQASIEDLVQPGTEALLREQRLLKAANEALTQERYDRTQQISRTQVEINDTAQRMQQLRDAVVAVRSELEVLEKDLQEEVAARSHATKLPKQRRTSKTPVIFLLQGGQLYAYVQAGPLGLERNTRETDVRTDLLSDYLVPRIGNGLRIATDGSTIDSLRDRLSEFDSTQHFIDIVVWNDSFTEFASLREALVDAGFDYRLTPMAEDEKVRLGTPADQAFVQ